MTRFRSGFTLIELLIVISVVALLTAFLLPALNTARNAARATICQAQLGQIGVASYAFSVDHASRLPPTLTGASHGFEYDRWYALLAGGGYLPGDVFSRYGVRAGLEAYQCPSDPTTAGFNEIGLSGEGTSYFTNYNVMPREDIGDLNSSGQGGYTIEQFKTPSARLMMTEKDASRENLGSGLQYGWWIWTDDLILDTRGHHAGHGERGSGNVLFVDGHAGRMAVDDIVEPGVIRWANGLATNPDDVVLWGLGRGE